MPDTRYGNQRGTAFCVPLSRTAFSKDRRLRSPSADALWIRSGCWTEVVFNSPFVSVSAAQQVLGQSACCSYARPCLMHHDVKNRIPKYATMAAQLLANAAAMPTLWASNRDGAMGMIAAIHSAEPRRK